MLCKFLLLVAMATHASLAYSNWREPKFALVVMDVQDCFLAGGSMAVPGGNDVIPVINRILQDYRDYFSVVAYTRVQHPRNYRWFASTYGNQYQNVSHPSVNVYNFPNQSICVNQCNVAGEVHSIRSYPLWPDHCLDGVTSGPESSKLASSLSISKGDPIISTGTYQTSYVDNEGLLPTISSSVLHDNSGSSNLREILEFKEITHVIFTGLTMDGTVANTAIDARKNYGDMKIIVVEDATRGRSDVGFNDYLIRLKQKGVEVIRSDEMAGVFQPITTGYSPNLTHCLPVLILSLFLAFGRSCIL